MKCQILFSEEKKKKKKKKKKKYFNLSSALVNLYHSLDKFSRRQKGLNGTRYTAIFTRETTFVTSCLFPADQSPSVKGS